MHDYADLDDQARVFELLAGQAAPCPATADRTGNGRDHVCEMTEVAFHGIASSFVGKQ